jgi:hypothetical protein
MVGVPGRSKGCITCRQRKVKCDEKRPLCERCQASWVPCEGYSRETVFVDESTRLRLSSEQSQQAVSSSGSTQTVSADAQTSESSELSRQRAILGNYPSRSMSLHAHQSNIYVSFLIHRLFSHPYRDRTASPWILRAIGEDATALVYNAAYCLAAALFERTHVLEHSDMAHGVIEYGNALRLLNRTIQDPSICYEPANVVATMLLSLYEMIIFTNRHGWIQHAGGIEKLIEMRGVDRHRTEPERHYFIVSRMLIITKALTLQRHTFLEQERWKTIPWADDPASKLSLHCIQDIFADIPGLLEDGNNLQAEHASQLAGYDIRAKTHGERLIKTLQELFLWRWEWERSNPDGAFEVTACPETLPSCDNLLPTYENVIRYERFEIAREIMLYNAALLWVFDTANFWVGENATRLALSLFPVQERPGASNPLTLPHEDLTTAEISREICRSIEYHFQEPHTQSGAMFLMLPLRTVLKLGQGAQERLLSERSLRRIGDIHGFGISTSLQHRMAMAADFEKPGG